MIKRSTFVLLMALAFSGCTPRKPAESTYKVSGTQAERVAEVTKIIGRSAKLPGTLLDAWFIEEKTGDGNLGPSDYRAYYKLIVPVADLPAWRAALPPTGPADTPPEYAAPRKPPAWWLPAADFSALEFHGPQSLMGRGNGWVGISKSGDIYIFTMTM